MNLDITFNWFVIVLRLFDGALYGTGFIGAVLAWVCFFQWLRKDKKNEKEK